MRYELEVNGELLSVDVSPGTSLLLVLRDELGLKGSKEACGRGECGACTVLYGVASVASCMMMIDLVVEPVWTIERLSRQLGTLRRLWADSGGFQCGFCTPGLIARAAALDVEAIRGGTDPRALIAGNICRCTGYVGLISALRAASQLDSGWIAGADGD